MIPELETAGFLVLAIRGLNKRHTRSTSPEFRMRHDWNSLLGTGWSLKPSPSIAMKGTCETISMLRDSGFGSDDQDPTPDVDPGWCV